MWRALANSSLFLTLPPKFLHTIVSMTRSKVELVVCSTNYRVVPSAFASLLSRGRITTLKRRKYRVVDRADWMIAPWMGGQLGQGVLQNFHHGTRDLEIFIGSE